MAVGFDLLKIVEVVVGVDEAVGGAEDVDLDPLHHVQSQDHEADHVDEILDQDPRASQNQEARARAIRNQDLNHVQDQSQEMINQNQNPDHHHQKLRRSLNRSQGQNRALVQSLGIKVAHDQEV